MFTGLIEEVGRLRERKAGGARLRIEAPGMAGELEAGESVAVCGACLTIVGRDHRSFEVDVSPESRKRTRLDRIEIGALLNLERALALGGRLGGHLVTGHVDGIGRLVERRRQGNSTLLRISAPQGLMPLIVEKGSIAVDGISLTVNALRTDSFELMIIPLSLEETNLGSISPGDELHLETDLIGKYVARLLGERSGKPDSEVLSLKALESAGFL